VSIPIKHEHALPRPVLAGARTLALLVVIASGCMTPRVPFEPTSGPPECMAKSGEFAPAEWGEFNADVARIASAMQFDETNPTLVHQRLDLAVRTLTDRQGCVLGGALGQPGGYTLSCGTLSASSEHDRANLEKVLREDLPTAVQSAQVYGEKCGSSMMSLVWTSGMPIGGVMAGCTSGGSADVCQRGCDNGNASACEIVWQSSKDLKVQTEAKARECEARLLSKNDPKMSTICLIAIGSQLGNVAGDGTPTGAGGSKARAEKLLSAACAAEPTGSACTTFSGKLDILSTPLRPRLIPGGGFYCAGLLEKPAWMTCGRDDCARTAATLSQTSPGWGCLQRPRASCFSYTIGDTPGVSCWAEMSRCLEILPTFEKNPTFRITDGCKELQ
jgi:hypothetical protein